MVFGSSFEPPKLPWDTPEADDTCHPCNGSLSNLPGPPDAPPMHSWHLCLCLSVPEGRPGGSGDSKSPTGVLSRPFSPPWSSWPSFWLFPGLPGSSHWRSGQVAGGCGGAKSPRPYRPYWLSYYLLLLLVPLWMGPIWPPGFISNAKTKGRRQQQSWW